MFLAFVPTGTISLKLVEAMGVPRLPHSLGEADWQSGARWLLPSGVLGGAMGPGIAPASGQPQDSTSRRNHS